MPRFLLARMATEEEIAEVEAQIVEDVEGGIQSTTVDGMSVQVSDPLRRLEALDKIKRNRVSDPFATLRHKKLVSGGGGQ